MAARMLSGVKRHYAHTGRNVAMIQSQVARGNALGGRNLGVGALSGLSEYRRGRNLAEGGTGIAARQHYVATIRNANGTRRAGAASGAYPFVTMELVAEPLLRELDRLARETTPAIMANTIRAVMMKLLGKIHLKTPVDTGLARSTWLVARGVVNSLAVPRMRGAGKLDIGPSVGSRWAAGADRFIVVESSLGTDGSEQFISVENNLDYIIPLEYGWSGQAPLGMVRLSIAEMSGRSGPEIAALFRAAWLEHMYEAGRELRAFSRNSRIGRVAGVAV